jgi:hypothetical protein
MTPEQQTMYDSILKGMSVEDLKKALIANVTESNDLETLSKHCMNAAMIFAKKAKL